MINWIRQSCIPFHWSKPINCAHLESTSSSFRSRPASRPNLGWISWKLSGRKINLNYGRVISGALQKVSVALWKMQELLSAHWAWERSSVADRDDIRSNFASKAIYFRCALISTARITICILMPLSIFKIYVVGRESNPRIVRRHHVYVTPIKFRTGWSRLPSSVGWE